MNAIKHSIKKAWIMLALSMMQLYVIAQDTAYSASTKTTTTTTSDQWYMQKWVWVVGGIIVLLILFALFSGGNKSGSRTDRVTVTKTVRTETDTD